MAAATVARGIYSLRDRGSSLTLNGSESHKNVLGSAVELSGMEKPLAAANNISLWINLAEPTVYLSGFDYDGRGQIPQNSSSILRGRLVLVVAKSVKIKAITMTFSGKARTEWPEGMHGTSDIPV